MMMMMPVLRLRRRGFCFGSVVTMRLVTGGLRIAQPGLLFLKFAQRFGHLEALAFEHLAHHRDLGDLLGVDINRKPVGFKIGTGAIGHEQLVDHIHGPFVMLDHKGEEEAVELGIPRSGKFLELRLREHARHVVVIVPVSMPVPVMSVRGVVIRLMVRVLIVFMRVMMVIFRVMGFVPFGCMGCIGIMMRVHIAVCGLRLYHAHVHFDAVETDDGYRLRAIAEPLLHQRDFILLRIDDAGRKPLHRGRSAVLRRKPRHDERLRMMHNHIGHEVHIGLHKIPARILKPLPVQGFELAQVGLRCGILLLVMAVIVTVTVLRQRGRTAEEKPGYKECAEDRGSIHGKNG